MSQENKALVQCFVEDPFKVGSLVYDAILVGARNAGTARAMLLAHKRYRVLLLDRATFPSDTMSSRVVKDAIQLRRWGLMQQPCSNDLFQGVFEGPVPIPEFFSPKNVRRIISAA